MSKQQLLALAATVLVAGLAPGAAEAKPRQAFSIMPTNITFGAETNRCPLGTVDFDIQSPAGAPLGTGTGCIQAIDPIGTRGQRAHVVFTFELAGGSIIVDATLREAFLSETSFAQTSHGKVVGGTGEFADVRGRLRGAGTIVFNPDGSVNSSVVFVVTLKGDDTR